MARLVRDAKLDTTSARAKLRQRTEPYWRAISEGMSIGYRKGKKGGTWIARHYTPSRGIASRGQLFKALGTADDVVDADGADVLSFAQAQERAREWFSEQGKQKRPRPLVSEAAKNDVEQEPIRTVRQACERYVEFLRAERKTGDEADKRLEKHVYPKLGNYPRLGDRLINDLATLGLRRLPTNCCHS
jgi:hypothetical protein